MTSDYVAVSMDSNADFPGEDDSASMRVRDSTAVAVGSRVRTGLLVAGLAFMSSCATAPSSETTSNPGVLVGDLAGLDGLFGFDVPVLGEDRWEVTLCQVPIDIDDPTYDPTDERLVTSPEQIVAAIEPMADYFDRWSEGRYTLTLMPGMTVAIDADDEAQACIESALETSSDQATGVIVVADAPHRDDVSGGWAQPGVGCATSSVQCPARLSRRAVYVGAADFFALMTNDHNVGDRIDSVPLDLLEHEIGHTFGWPHSSHETNMQFADGSPPQEYNSVIDIMSNSAAPRAADSDRRHGPGVLAFNRLSAGWLAPREVVVANATQLVAQSFTLASLETNHRDRQQYPLVVVLELDETSAVTIELVVDQGDNDHLERSGLAVHVVQWGDQVCPVPRTGGYCLGVDRRVTLVGVGSDGLIGVGQSVTVGELTVALTAMPGTGSNTRAEVAIWRQ